MNKITFKSTNFRLIKKILFFIKTSIYWVSGITVLIHLVGLLAAHKEHYYLVMAYTILMIFALAGSILVTIAIPYFSFCALIYICTIIIASMYLLYDLRYMRRQLSISRITQINTNLNMSTPIVIDQGWYDQHYGQTIDQQLSTQSNPPQIGVQNQSLSPTYEPRKGAIP